MLSSYCCDDILKFLPLEQMCFLPAFCIGIIISLLIIAEVHKKQFGKTFLQSLKDIYCMLFVTFPEIEHDSSKCINKKCAKCENDRLASKFALLSR